MEITSQLAYQIYENVKEGIVVTDVKGIIQSVNKAYCNITGYYAEELVGQKINMIRSNVHDQPFYQTLWESLNQEGQWDGEVWNRHKHGHIYLQRLHIFTIKDEGNNMPLYYIGVTADISKEDKLRKDILTTAKLQKTLLPPPIWSHHIEIKGVYKPSNYLSGDFYDYFWNEEKTIFKGYMIDIMGHGITAAYQNSILRVLFKQNFQKEKSLDKILQTINQESFLYFLEDTFAAAVCFELDIENKTLSVASAGINKYIRVLKNGEKRFIKHPGAYLGIVKDTQYQVYIDSIDCGESCYFVTDGLMDILEKKEEILGFQFNANINTLCDLSRSGLRDDASAIGIHIKS